MTRPRHVPVKIGIIPLGRHGPAELPTVSPCTKTPRLILSAHTKRPQGIPSLVRVTLARVAPGRRIAPSTKVALPERLAS